jgi:hypothetical protein
MKGITSAVYTLMHGDIDPTSNEHEPCPHHGFPLNKALRGLTSTSNGKSYALTTVSGKRKPMYLELVIAVTTWNRSLSP